MSEAEKAVVIAVDKDEEHGDYVVYLSKTVIHPMLRDDRISYERWNHILVDDPPEVGTLIEFEYYDGWHWRYVEEI